MRFLRIRSRQRVRLAALAAFLATTVSVGACEDFLVAENPGAVETRQLEDTSMIGLLANGVVGEFQPLFPWLTYYSGLFVDELRNHHVFFEEGLFDQRRVDPANGTWSFFMYSPVQRTRWLADSVASRIRALEGDSASRDLRLARTYAFGGYTLVIMGELMCEAPLGGLEGQQYSRPYTSDEMFEFAIQRFDAAIEVAAASKAAATAAAQQTADTRATIAGADSIRNLALVGAGRAALNRGEGARAIQYAQQVAPIGTATDFEFRIYFSDNPTTGVTNIYSSRLSGGSGVTTGSVSGTPFIGLDDARVPHPLTATGTPQAEPTMGGSWVVPNSPPSFSTFDGTKTGRDFTLGGSIRLASLLEAKYIVAEAGGPAGTNIGGQSNIAFIESRRTAFPSTTAATATTATNYMDNLIDQRRRDFFLDGHRMGDLRRYLKRYNIDKWQRGTMPSPPTNTTFAANHCLPITTAEIINNPSVPKPYTPPTGP